MSKTLILSETVKAQVEMLRTAMTSTIRWSSGDVDTDLRPILEELLSVRAPDLEAQLRARAFSGRPAGLTSARGIVNRPVVNLDDALAIIKAAVDGR
jgi:hypothetical protein